MVGRLTLDQVVGVRVPAPQPLKNTHKHREYAAIAPDQLVQPSSMAAMSTAISSLEQLAHPVETGPGRVGKEVAVDVHRGAELAVPQNLLD
jgi:hypothetical protein